MSCPSKRISPVTRVSGLRSIIRLNDRRSVLLPQPEGPIRAVILLRGMSSVMSLSAGVAPNQTERSRVERIGEDARDDARGEDGASGMVIAGDQPRGSRRARLRMTMAKALIVSWIARRIKM